MWKPFAVPMGAHETELACRPEQKHGKTALVKVSGWSIRSLVVSAGQARYSP
ncbi:MAG: hypothetical protein NZL98_04050 [Anaerolineales bacterium]|nr:hypothetical protein [Anaerolineales bacterium]